MHNPLKRVYHQLYWKVRSGQLFGSKCTNLIFYPDFCRENPYQLLLYTEFPEKGFRCLPSTVEKAASIYGRSKTLFHLHWTSPILGKTCRETEAVERKNRFISALDLFMTGGGKFVWTVHNLTPHRTGYPEQETELRRQIAERADLIMVHSLSAKKTFCTLFGEYESKVLIFEHGNYIDVYPNRIDRRYARKKFGISEESRVFLFLGQLRPNKGVESLIHAFHSLESKQSKLIIAGKPARDQGPGFYREPAGKNKNIIVHERFVPARKLQLYFNAADIVVLPLNNTLTSGSLLLALSFARPVIAPDTDPFTEIIDDHHNGLLYRPDNEKGLEAAMQRYLGLTQSERSRMAENAFKTAEKFSWKDISGRLAEEFRSLF